MLERFFIDSSIRGVNRYNMSKFLNYDEDNYDPLTSTFLQELQSLPVAGVFLVTNEVGRIDMVSSAIYDSPDLYWVLAFYNGLTSPEEIVAGTQIRYPSRQNLEIFVDSMQARKQAS